MPLSNLANINPRLQYAQQRVNNALLISLEKAAAHLEDPTHYPLPNGQDSLEASICALVNTYSKKHKDRFLDKLKAKVHQTADQRKQHYGDLAAIDLHKAVSVEEQVSKIAVPEHMKITEADIEQLKQSPDWKSRLFNPPLHKGTARQAAAATNMKVSVPTISCQETNDRKRDEISVSAVIISSNGFQFSKDSFFSDKFHVNDNKSTGAAGDLFTLPLDDSSTGGFPVTFTLSLIMIEKDLFHNPGTSDKVSSILRLTGKLVSAASVGLLFIPGIGIPLGFSVMGAGVLAIIVGELFLFRADTISSPATDLLVLDAAPLAGETIDRTVNFQFEKDGFVQPGKYTAAIHWEAQ